MTPLGPTGAHVKGLVSAKEPPQLLNTPASFQLELELPELFGSEGVQPRGFLLVLRVSSEDEHQFPDRSEVGDVDAVVECPTKPCPLKDFVTEARGGNDEQFVLAFA